MAYARAAESRSHVPNSRRCPPLPATDSGRVGQPRTSRSGSQLLTDALGGSAGATPAVVSGRIALETLVGLLPPLGWQRAVVAP